MATADLSKMQTQTKTPSAPLSTSTMNAATDGMKTVEGNKELTSAASVSTSSEGSSAPELAELLAEHGLVAVKDSGLIRWANSNQRHPRNWSVRAKAFNAVVILILEFITSAIGTAGTAAAQEMQADYHISTNLSIFLLTSTYLIGQGLGSVFFPPYSESFGRKSLYIGSTVVYAGFSAIAAGVHAIPAVVIGRFVSGLSSAVPTIVVAGSMEDLFNVKARVWMIFVWSTVGNVAISVGPIYSAYVTQNLGWRWVFWIAIIGLSIMLVFCLLLRETRPSLLLEREVKALQKILPGQPLKALNPDETPDLKTLLAVTLVRPLRLLFTEPIVMSMAFVNTVTLALFYLQAESLPLVFEAYGWSMATASLGFVPIVLGCLVSVFMRFYDRKHLADIVRAGKRAIEPEDKLTGFAVAAPICALGLWLFAWTIPPLVHVHWIVPMIVQFMIGFALNENYYTLTGYIADSYTIFAASGFAGLVLARGSAAAIILPFTGPFYHNLGYNYASTVLAAISTACCIIPVVFIKYGKRIREASAFARYSLTTYHANTVENDLNDKQEGLVEVSKV